MVTGIRRSQSLQGGATTLQCSEKKTFHARSTSLPSRSHPAVARFDDHIDSLRSLPPHPDQIAGDGATWLADGLHRIELVHAALADILHLPSTTTSAWAERFLDDALRLADIYAALNSATTDLKQHAAEARAAIRRSDGDRLSSALRSYRRAEKELARLNRAIKNIARPSFSVINSETAAEVEVAGIVREVIVATASASVAILDGISTVSSAASAAAKDSCARRWWAKRVAWKKKGRMEEEAAGMVAMEKLEGLEECIERMDRGSEKVFRALVNTRVALLNILTPSL